MTSFLEGKVKQEYGKMDRQQLLVRLREMQEELQSQGVESLAVFGSSQLRKTQKTAM